MKSPLKYSVFFCFLLLLSCGEIPTYEKSYSFENNEWEQDVKPEFKVQIKDIRKEYNFTLSLRTTTDYKYNNLWVFMKTEAPDGTTAREPFEIRIVDPNGNWIGNKSGSIVETSLFFRKRKLPLKGTYTFILEQGITFSKIDEVVDLSFIVDEVKE